MGPKSQVSVSPGSNYTKAQLRPTPLGNDKTIHPGNFDRACQLEQWSRNLKP